MKIKILIKCIIMIFFFLHSFKSYSQEITQLNTPLRFNNLNNNKIGYFDFIPLPPYYSLEYSLKDRVFTGEVYSKDGKLPISAKKDLFVPKDYIAILESIFVNTLKQGLLDPKKYETFSEAENDNVPVLIWCAPVIFHVEGEKKAIVKLIYRIYQVEKKEVLWEGEISSSFIHYKMPSSLIGTEIFRIGEHKFNFQPQRSHMAFATYNCMVDFMNRLKDYLK